MTERIEMPDYMIKAIYFDTIADAEINNAKYGPDNCEVGEGNSTGVRGSKGLEEEFINNDSIGETLGGCTI